MSETAAPPSTESLVESALAEATDSGAFDDVNAVDTTPEPVEAASDADPVVEAVPDAVVEASVDTPVAEDTRSDIDKLLEAEGIKPTVENQRENRIPYKRVAKIVENAQKKVIATHEAEVTEVRTKLTAAELKNKQMDAVDSLIVSDPDRYIGMLASLHPEKYKRFLTGNSAPTQPVIAKPAAVEPAAARPQPDTRYEDGSLGYSPQQHEKLLTWVADTARKQAVAESAAEFTKRFGPIEEKWKADQLNAQFEPKVRAQMDRNTTLWGPEFTKEVNLGNKSPLLQLIHANPSIPADAIIAQYMTPKRDAAAKERENNVRADVLKEMATRAKAAAKTAPASVAANTDTSGPMSTEDTVRNAMRTLGV